MDTNRTTSIISAPHEYQTWLSLLGKTLGSAKRGCLATYSQAGEKADSIYHLPDAKDTNDDLVRLCQRVKKENKGVVLFFEADNKNSFVAHIGSPVVIGKSLLVYSFEVTTENRQHVNKLMFQLECGLHLLRESVEYLLSAKETGNEKLSGLLKLAETTLNCPDFSGSAQHLVNTLHNGFELRRVSFGCLKNNQIHIEAISHQSSHDKNSQLVRDITLAMEECCDQGEVIHYPPSSTSPGPVSLLLGNLCRPHDSAQALALPIATGSNNPSFVLLIENGADKVLQP